MYKIERPGICRQHPRLIVGKLSSRMTGENRGSLLVWEHASCCFLAENAKYSIDVVK